MRSGRISWCKSRLEGCVLAVCDVGSAQGSRPPLPTKWCAWARRAGRVRSVYVKVWVGWVQPYRSGPKLGGNPRLADSYQ